MKDRIWLSSPHMGGTELKYIHEAFDANWVAPLGPNVNGFEDAIQKYLNEDRQVASLSSGTAAIHLALILAGVQAGDEVICQSMTFAASANPITYLGAKPVFVDSETKTWNICPNALEDAIKDRIKNNKVPKAIVAVHLYGMPYQVDEVHEVANKYNIPVIEDSAEALGSLYKNKKCSTFGDFGILSFNGNKIITTSGGGAMVVKDEKMKSRAIFLATQARDDAPHYQHSTIGYNYRMSNISAGIGRGQMEVLDKHVQLRRNIHTFYKNIFKDFDGITMQEEPSKEYYSNFWLTAIYIDSSKINTTREKLRLALWEDNIESRPLWKPMHLQPIFKNCLYFGGDNANDLFANGLCLPSGSNLKEEELNRIDKKIREHLNAC